MPTPSEIQTCIDNLDSSSQPIDFTILAAETSQANTGISFSVATVEDLPTYSDVGLGQIFFVESIGVPVISTRSGWSGLDGRVLSGDTGAQNALFTWGCNRPGALGIGDTNNRCSPIREICFGSNWCQVSSGNSCVSHAIKSSGELWGWGLNDCGQIGDGTTTASGTGRCSPVREFCSATNWCQVASGTYDAHAIKTDGTLWVWGRGTFNWLGAGNTSGTYCWCSPVQEYCCASDWCQVSRGQSSSAAIKTDGSLWTWGQGTCGLLGTGSAPTASGSPVREFCSATDWCQASVGKCHVGAVKTTGQIWMWGVFTCGRLGNGLASGLANSPVQEYCCATDWCALSLRKGAGTGGFGASALKTTGEIWSWGVGAGGELGNGNSQQSCSPVREFCSATDWCYINAGHCKINAIKTSGELWGWGINGAGELGDGTSQSRCSPVREISSSTDWCQVGGGALHTMAIRVIT